MFGTRYYYAATRGIGIGGRRLRAALLASTALVAAGSPAAASFEGEFSNLTRSYAGKGVVRYSW